MYFNIFSAVLIFIVSQYFLELVIKPYIRYRETLYKVDYKLKFYANVVSASYIQEKPEEYRQVVEAIRDLSCDLEASYRQINLKKIYQTKLFHLPKKNNISKALANLISISNSVGEKLGPGGNLSMIGEIRKLLMLEAI